MVRTDEAKKFVLEGRVYVKSPSLSTRDIMIIRHGKEHLYAKKLNNLLHEHIKNQVTILLDQNDVTNDLVPEDSKQKILRKTNWASIPTELWIDGERPQRRYKAKQLLAKEATRVKITVEILDEV